MNPLTSSKLSPQLMQNIQQVKHMMRMVNGDPTVLAQQNPMLSQVMQMCRGQNPQQMFMDLCKNRGIDPNAILNELRN